MSSRLRRMLLVNVRTSGKFSSGAINEVDPRDGAAVTGDNAVGKTTTLELVPLFFGNLPSQIAESGGGREPMLRFVLPHSQSAIVFEYQRGPADANDVRFVVLRRQDGSDAPEYRFFRGPFREDIFIMHNPDGLRVFMDDAQSVDATRGIGVEFERKLNSADYRAVILGLKATNQDAVKLRQMSMHYSFAQKSLPNLDRLVAAVVKEKVDFRDFVNVAVTMVQDTIGGPAMLGVDRNRFSLRQSRNQIIRWLSDRDACENAFKQEGKVQTLKATLTDYNRQESVLREMRADVRAILKARQAEKPRILVASEELAEARKKAVEVENETLSQLNQRVIAITDASAQAKSDHEEDNARYRHFMSERVEVWETSVNTLPGLRYQRTQLQNQIEIAQGQASNIASGYDQQIGAIKEAGAQEENRLEVSKAAPNNRHKEETVMLRADEDTALEVFDEQARLELDALDDERSTLDMQMGEARALADRPQASPEAVQACEAAAKKLADHQQAIFDTQNELRAANGQFYTAEKAFNEAEIQHNAATRAQESTRQNLQQAQLTLTPPGGTLLSTLRSVPDTDWKSTLARVIDPALLQRTDLSPRQMPVEAMSDSVFGWTLDTNQIAAPDWVNDDAMRNMVRQCTAALDVANSSVARMQARLKETSDHLGQAKKKQELAQSKYSVLEGKLQGLKDSHQIAIEKRDRQRKEAAQLVSQRMESIKGEIDTLKSRRIDLQRGHQTTRAAIQGEFQSKREAADKRLETALKRTEDQITAHKEKVQSRIDDLSEQRGDHLRNAGVDVEKLNSLAKEVQETDSKITELEVKSAQVILWQKWLANGGRSRLDELERKATAAESARKDAQGAEDAHKKDMRNAQTRHDDEVSRLHKRLVQVGQDISELESIEESYGSYVPVHPSIIDINTPVASLRGWILEHRNKLDHLEGQIHSLFRQVREVLTAKENSVRDLVELSLVEVQGQSLIRQAEELCAVYRRIGREIVPNVNNEVKSILENIRQFRKKITDFETEVHRFNNKLQSGLDSVSMFERLRDFKINVVTDFSALGFMKKLESLDDVIRDQQMRIVIDNTRELPPEKTASALRDFMSVIGHDGALEVDLSSHITLSGSVTVSGVVKQFRRESDLEHISSNGLNAIILITLLSGMLNMIRSDEPIFIPWVTDEVGKFDSQNFHTLMQMLKDNRIDVVTASPKLTIQEFRHFARCYRFGDRGSIAMYAMPGKKHVPARAVAAMAI